MSFLLHATSADNLFVDVGGYCFEPVPSTFTRLLRNLAINDLSRRVMPMNIGVSDIEGILRFTSGNNCGNRVATDNETSGGSVTIPVQPLDIILKDESPSTIKIDVEGFESKVLAGASETLAKPSLTAVIMEVSGPNGPYGFEQSSVLTVMAEHNFAIYCYDPLTRKLSPKADPNIHGNTLFIRDASNLQEKLFKSPPIQLGSL